MPARIPTPVEDLLMSLLERLEPTGQSPGHRAWLRPTIYAIINFPWEETELPDGRKPPLHDTAVELLLFLIRNLDEDSPPPTSINPTGEGGATAQWHMADYDFEIFCEPDGRPEYSITTLSTEFEGEVQDEEDRKGLRAFLELMPRERRE